MNNRNRFVVIILLFALLATACGTKVKSPLVNINYGPNQTADLLVPTHEAATGVELNLEFLAGNLQISPGATGSLASGTATYNTVEFEPFLETSGSISTLKSGKVEIKGIPTNPEELINKWDLQLADTPMSLNIKTGPYEGNFELGGLSLEKLYIDEIGSEVKISFTEPNQVEMSSFTYMTGGSEIEIKGLANANFEQMTFNSGAGSYTLSFDGLLQRDANVSIDSGAATVNIVVPQGVNAQVTFDGGLTGIEFEGGWSQNGNVYTLSGSGPTITIMVTMGLGSLILKTE
jgi:hypothetical protein